MDITGRMNPARWRKSGSSAAFGLFEVLISTTVGVATLAALLTLVSVVAREQRRELVNCNLQHEANLLEDRITRLVRSMSATEAVILGEPITSGSPFCRSIIMARGPAPTAREKLAYNSRARACVYTPNTASADVTNAIFAASTIAVLRDLYFFISEKADGAPDASAVSVYFKMDDNGMAFANKTNSVTRMFTATMRNN